MGKLPSTGPVRHVPGCNHRHTKRQDCWFGPIPNVSWLDRAGTARAYAVAVLAVFTLLEVALTAVTFLGLLWYGALYPCDSGAPAFEDCDGHAMAGLAIALPWILAQPPLIVGLVGAALVVIASSVIRWRSQQGGVGAA
jgi:hypothetical protein